MSAAEFTEASAKISEVEANVKRLEEKIEGQERSYPASVRPAEVTVELEQLRKQEIILLEELVELRKYKNILLTKEAAAQEQAARKANAEALEKIMKEFNVCKPREVFTFGLGRLLGAYYYSSKIRVAVVLYGFLAVLVALLAYPRWAPIVVCIVMFCYVLADVYRNYEIENMKWSKEHVEKAE
ncbi:hypothetical protein QJQ45_024334 [Haematococcus lacustris]|nr:hypothetical protein QJQ45_024334 [Haematococcus lacustris]